MGEETEPLPPVAVLPAIPFLRGATQGKNDETDDIQWEMCGVKEARHRLVALDCQSGRKGRQLAEQRQRGMKRWLSHRERSRHEPTNDGRQSSRAFLLLTAVHMPSLFSRARTTSSPLKAQRQSADLLDEFGRVPSRGNGGLTVPAAKKDKNVEKTRTRTLSAAKGRAPGPLPNDEDSLIPDGSFFPLNLDLPPPGSGSSDPAAGHHPESERGS